MLWVLQSFSCKHNLCHIKSKSGKMLRFLRYCSFVQHNKYTYPEKNYRRKWVFRNILVGFFYKHQIIVRYIQCKQGIVQEIIFWTSLYYAGFVVIVALINERSFKTVYGETVLCNFKMNSDKPRWKWNIKCLEASSMDNIAFRLDRLTL